MLENFLIFQMEQILCASGYSIEIAGFASSSILLSGCAAALPVGIIASKHEKRVVITKVFLLITVAASGVLAYFLTVPGHHPSIIITFCVITGIFSIG